MQAGDSTDANNAIYCEAEDNARDHHPSGLGVDAAVVTVTML